MKKTGNHANVSHLKNSFSYLHTVAPAPSALDNHRKNRRPLKQSFLAVSLGAILAGGALTPVKDVKAFGLGSFFSFGSSIMGSMFDMFTDIAGAGVDMFVGAMTFFGKSFEVMIDFSKIALGIMDDFVPFQMAKDGFARMMEISMRISREIMRQDPGFIEFATVWGFKTYKAMANMFPGDLEDQLMAEVFKTMMINDKVAVIFLKLAQDNKGMALLMERIASKDSGLRNKLAAMMANSNSVANNMLSLALSRGFIARLLLNNIDSGSYNALTQSMVNSASVSRKAVKLLYKYADDYLTPDSKLVKEMADYGEISVPRDGNEQAMERFIYATFSDYRAANGFMDILESRSPQIQGMLLNLVFLGQTMNGEHFEQSLRNNNAMLDAMMDSIFDGNIRELMSDPDSDASQLFQRVMPILFEFDNTGMIAGPTVYGMRFMQAMMIRMQTNPDPKLQELMEIIMSMLPPDLVAQLMAGAATQATAGAAPAPAAVRTDQVGMAAVNVTSRNKDVEKVQYPVKGYVHQPVYRNNDDDLWLLVPNWMQTATWYRTHNDDRNINNDDVAYTLDLPADRGHSIFLVVPFDASYPLWAIKNGYVEITDERFESTEQTAFRLFGKHIHAGEQQTELLYGNEDGDRTYTFAVIEENGHANFNLAASIISKAATQSRPDWLLTRTYDRNEYREAYRNMRPDQGFTRLGYWGGDGGNAYDSYGVKDGKLELMLDDETRAQNGDIVKLLNVRESEARQYLLQQADDAYMSAITGYRIAGYFDSDNDALDSYGTKDNWRTLLLVKQGYEDYVKLHSIGNKSKLSKNLPGYRIVARWQVDGDSVDSFGTYFDNGEMSLQIRELDQFAGQTDNAAFDPGLNMSVHHIENYLNIENPDTTISPEDINTLRARYRLRNGRRNPRNRYEMATTAALNITDANYSGRYIVNAINNNDNIRNPFGRDDDDYITRMTGRIEVPQSGEWTFAINGDIAVEVRIDGVLVTARYDGQSGDRDVPLNANTITLQQGYHHIEFLHENSGGNTEYYLYWQAPDADSLQPVSELRFSHPRYDADMDGVSDAFDQCANTLPGTLIERNGCSPSVKTYVAVSDDGFGGAPLPASKADDTDTPDVQPPSWDAIDAAEQAAADQSSTDGATGNNPTPPAQNDNWVMSGAWLTSHIVKRDSSSYGVPAGYNPVAWFDVRSDGYDINGMDTNNVITLGIRDDAQLQFGDILMLVNASQHPDKIENSGANMQLGVLPGYSQIGYFYPDGGGTTDTFGNRKQTHTSVLVIDGFEDFVKLVAVADNTTPASNGYTRIASWRVDGVSSDSAGNIIKAGEWIALEIRDLDNTAGTVDDSAYDPGLLLSIMDFAWSLDSNDQSIDNKFRHPQSAQEFEVALRENASRPDLHYAQFTLANINNPDTIRNPFGSNDSFLTYMRGRIYAEEAGLYQFAIDGDDAIELRIDASPVIAWYSNHSAKDAPQKSTSIYLSAGYHSIEYLHENGSGNAEYMLYWNTPADSTLRIIPDNVFSHARYDSDGDGVADGADNCPASAPGTGININGCQ